jgi:ATP/maltotriose-dependent transcriptional regulator MalT
MIAGERDRARPLFDVQAERARGLGDERVLADVLGMLANLECRAGNAELARRRADAAVEMVRSIQEPVSLAFVLYWSGRVRALLGLVEEAHADIEEAIEASERLGHKLFRICCVDVLGYLSLATGRLDAAQDHLESVLDGVREVRWREPAALDAFQHLAEVYVLRGDLDRAEAVLEDLATRLSPASGVRPRAGALRVRGLIAAARGDADAAVSLLEESLVLQARLPEPHESGRTLLHLGSLLRRANRRRAARDRLEEAVRVLDGCGARVWAERARSELGRIGGRPVRTGALTPTEQQIADLVAAGRSNHEVARALSLSPKTVEWNLSKIYRKLHVRSRSELGAKLRKRRAEAV